MTESLVTQIALAALDEHPRTANRILDLLLQTERLSPEQLVRQQLSQLQIILKHAYGTVPYYRNRPAAARQLELALLSTDRLTLEQFRELPVISREDVQTHAESIESTSVAKAHRPVAEAATSGSTGRPLNTKRSGAISRVFRGIRRRFHRWQQRDANLKAAFIVNVMEKGRAEPPHGERGGPWMKEDGTAPGVVLTLRAPIDAQLDWLAREKPAYLATFSSNALALLKRAQERGIDLPGLRDITVSSEPVSDELRELTRSVWGARLVATYSANEVGAIALQAGDSEHYLVQSENLLVEVLDEQGAACRPGTIGRVVVTTLQDAIRPLIRYAVGDYAEVGGASPCGRGLPVLTRIMGRERNLLQLPNGDKVWPFFELEPLIRIQNLLQWQLLQPSPSELVVRVVSKAALTPSQEQTIANVVQEFLPAKFNVRILRVQSIERTPGGKFEEFVSNPERVRALLESSRVFTD